MCKSPCLVALGLHRRRVGVVFVVVLVGVLVLARRRRLLAARAAAAAAVAAAVGLVGRMRAVGAVVVVRPQPEGRVAVLGQVLTPGLHEALPALGAQVLELGDEELLRGEPDLQAPVLPPPRQQLHLRLLEELGSELAHLAREQEAMQRVEEAPALCVSIVVYANNDL